ncbi:putative nuclease of putative toxin-antitoxin system [Flavobacterium sp. PL11]|uniref:DUF5615 family PIN-like protein n=1 Tax=Flavobacterium sp. PL11 TaxID=3071717 RepID=UPI002E085E29|nr:putative nuclease of putative toxin-antitoxin system [Flavobacterium sp. PL11]
MKLLFDQNILFRILSKIKVHFPEAKQVRQLGIENYSDLEIWKFAKENQFTIVTFDSDFFDLLSLQGHPVNIIWLRFGYTFIYVLSTLLITKASITKDFTTLEAYYKIACLEINN